MNKSNKTTATDIRVIDVAKPIQIFCDPNDGSKPILPLSIPALMKQAVDNYPNHNALMFKNEGDIEWKGVTYKEYGNRVEKTAKIFIKLGLEPRGTVAVLAFNSVEWFVSELAAIHAG